jgi:hypothetical protein
MVQTPNGNSLLLVTVNGKSGPAVLAKILGDFIRYTFCAHKYEYLGVLRRNLVEMLDEFGPLLELAADFDELLNVVVGRELHRTNVDLNEVLEEILLIGKLA